MVCGNGIRAKNIYLPTHVRIRSHFLSFHINVWYDKQEWKIINSLIVTIIVHFGKQRASSAVHCFYVQFFPVRRSIPLT